jgi:hypothetical protein
MPHAPRSVFSEAFQRIDKPLLNLYSIATSTLGRLLSIRCRRLYRVVQNCGAIVISAAVRSVAERSRFELLAPLRGIINSMQRIFTECRDLISPKEPENQEGYAGTRGIGRRTTSPILCGGGRSWPLCARAVWQPGIGFSPSVKTQTRLLSPRLLACMSLKNTTKTILLRYGVRPVWRHSLTVGRSTFGSDCNG